MLINCTGEQTNTYDPPVTDAPRTISLKTEARFGHPAGLCIDNVPGLTSGSDNRISSLSNFSCNQVRAPVLEGPPTTITLHWNNGQTSTVLQQTVQNVRGAGTTEFTTLGIVTDGLGEGGTYVKQVVFPNTDLDACSTSGLSQVTGPVVITITALL